jgi:uncharacterized protein YlxW (UPF0749 family)
LRARHVDLRFLPDKQPEAEHDLLFNTGSRLFCMQRISIAILLAVMPLALLSSSAQAPDPKEEQQQILALVKEVQAQQAQIVANQAKIDAKLADLAETLHTARIFSSRSR